MLKNRNKINLNEISHDSAIGLINRVPNMRFLLTEWVMLRSTELNCLKDFRVSNLWLQRLIVSIQLSQEIEPCGNGCLTKRQITCTGTSVPDTLEAWLKDNKHLGFWIPIVGPF
ncbi:uncharacterized protein LOC121241335 isoform X2 [Juglans microcarpa x Juglans regia]|uniref:uncharacterized protein LOC121241335 isoform X2 n=1 Tax=Juglans microcarpa x Juglans regia TaxID=2249226 RepID=UPI001B7E507F|nr:uncharacterized protein LOC121241335 isoform X2 [Juglans microcarpa x Juglans regia]